MSQNPVIIFVCEHGAAKSIIAATYFNKLAREKGLDVSAVARGTHPDAELSQKAIEGLHEDKLVPICAKGPPQASKPNFRKRRKIAK